MKYASLMFMFYFILETWCWFPTLKYHEKVAAKELLNMLVDVIKDTNERIGHLSNIKQDCEGRASFEMGYLMYVIQDKYRRMVDKYHATCFMRYRYYSTEFVMPLEEIEHHYWEIEHLANMLHEIERKYKIKGDLDEDYEFPSTLSISTVATKRTRIHTLCQGLSDLQNKILNEVSWPIKLKLLKGYEGSTKHSAYRRVGVQAYRMEKKLRVDESEDVMTTPGNKHDESNMKMKLFRLMYETIRDSDVKVKRAEVIKKYYTNSTSFNIGYVMAEITERFNVMKDIAMTLKRLYAEWKPMEHINAYEQIANKAVELCNMVDLARSMLKHDPHSANNSDRYKQRH